ASARVKLSQGATPPAVEDVIREIEHLNIEIAAIEREQAGWADHAPHLAELKARKTEAEKKRDELQERLVRERDLVQAIRDALAQRIQTARAELSDPRRPIGVFLLVGPSGVGKTETALALADLLYGGDRNMVVVNMSEFKEEYKVSQLIGSPRGYEGSGEGGVL